MDTKEKAVRSQRDFSHGEPIIIDEKSFPFDRRYFCNVCKQWKDREEFTSNTYFKRGFRHECKACDDALRANRKLRGKNADNMSG